MPDASYLQTNFLGGEWSPNAQGRADHPNYKTAMSTCLNGLPLEEGAWMRRPGFMFAATTRGGAKGRLLDWDFTDQSPYSVELTANHARVFQGRNLVMDSAANIADISLDSPAIVTLTTEQTWATGDQGQILFNSVGMMTDCVELRNRQFVLTKIGSSGLQYSLSDPVTGDPVTITYFNPETDLLQLGHILDLATSYTDSDWPTVRSVQAAEVGPLQSDVMLLLHAKYPPLSLDAVPNPNALNFVNVTVGKQDFADGPYLDPVSGSLLSVSGGTGPTVTLTIEYEPWSSTTAYTLGDFVTSGGSDYQCLVETSLNSAPPSSDWALMGPGSAVGPNGFQSTDVGRQMRLFSEPAPWQAGTSYVTGNAVSFNNGYYTCIQANVGNEPDTNLSEWLISDSQSVFTWTWGKITTVNSQSQVVLTLLGPNLLYSSLIYTWQMGVYSNTTGWPTYGCFFQGRLYLISNNANRVDGSQSDDFYGFSPTAPDGTVGDANGLTVIANDKGDNSMLWIEPHSQVLLASTRAGTWLLNASTLNDPITPDSAQFVKVTATKGLDIPPAKTPLTVVYAQAFGRQFYELFQEVFSKIVTPNLNIFAKHLTTGGIKEIAYQSELAPIIWSRNGDGTFIGCTYRRNSIFASEDPKFVGYHRHTLGSGRVVESLIVTPTPDETAEMVQVVTNDPTTGVRHVEMSTPFFDTDSTLYDAFFLDDGATPAAIVPSSTGITLYGFWHLNGKTVSAFIAGLDCGDYTVANGAIFVPWQADPGKLFTAAYLAQVPQNVAYGDLGTTLEQQTVTTPARAGNGYGLVQQGWPTNQTVGQGTTLLIDWGRNTAWIPSSDNHSSFNQVDLLTMRGIQYVPSSIFSPPTTDVYGLGPSGDLYGFMDGVNNSGRVGRWGGNPLTFKNNISSVLNPGILCPIDLGSVEYLVSSNYTFNGDGMFIANMNTYTVLQTYNNTVIPSTGSVCRGPSNGEYCSAYHITNCAANGTLLTLRKITITGDTGILLTTFGTISPSQVDPHWTIISAQGDMSIDQTDGNLITSFYNDHIGITNQTYLVKVNSATGAIMWALPLVNSISLPVIGSSRIANGYFCFVENQNLGSPGVPRRMFFVDTIAGVGTTLDVDFGGSNAGATTSFFDALAGRMMVMTNYSAGNSAKTPLQGQGTQSSFTGFAQYFNGTLFAPTVESSTRTTIPGGVGFTFTSQGQLLRPLAPQEAGAANGPALGKTRRSHMFGILLAAAVTGSVSFGTLFSKLRSATFRSNNQLPYATNQLYSGVHWNTLDDDYSFDSQFAWQITRPYPLTIAAAGAFLNTQDR